MRVRKLTFVALAVAAGLSLTACDKGDDKGQGDPKPESASSSGGSGSEGSGQGEEKGSGGQGSGAEDSASKDSGGQGTAGSGSGVDGKVAKCRTDDLDISASDSSISDEPEGTVTVEMKNGSGQDCSMSGYAGVDLKTSEGALSAKRSGQPAGPDILKDGDSTFFPVNYPLNDSGGSGVSVSALVVTPPDETKSVSIEWPGSATLPVTDGAGSPVTVGPIGSAGQGGAN
ncbi:DUF4232 domain-containing protein [Streptomyces flavofungini]|uniref:DUF4232 domain-containing protein n=1 Tax=Streptomyces flavofungini TaxID=68200 RepID=A0ABS0XHA2_9ACTN|nr:DUF4232 domain-containing protein [Streptomyces flavofungini]MBJ3812589.1 DUF4232 domain-containing protein [Streptomyces flavofungini]GHC87791.1 hypothetical protein GCM10010349_74660 [Streptomyces flavofungini]